MHSIACMKNLHFLVLGLMVALGACGKKSSGSNNTAYDPYNPAYTQPQYSPPNHNWNNYAPGYVPQGNCGYQPTLPSNCAGTYNGYNYCGNQWYYHWDNNYWAFPAFGSCGNTGGGNIGGGGNHGDDDWWDSDDDGGGGNNGGGGSVTNYSSGWKKIWGVMGSSEHKYITIKVPKTGTYYISFKGDYTGKSQSKEKLTTYFSGGNKHSIKDLDQTHTGSGEVQRSCKVNVNFKLKGGETYKIYLKGTEQSVNDTYLRITSYWPGDISKLCN